MSIRIIGQKAPQRATAMVKSIDVPVPSGASLALSAMNSAVMNAASGSADGRVRATVMNATRPSNLIYRFNSQTNWWTMYDYMDFYQKEVSVLSTIILRATTELFRHDLSLEPAFCKRCEECGYESQTEVDRCPQCGSARLRKPEERQKDYFIRPNGKSFLEEANANGQSLKDVLKTYAQCEYLYNQAYVLCVTGDIVDEESGRLLKAYPLEFLAQNPSYVKYLYDRTGVPGNTYAFVRENRESLINMDEDEDAVNDITAEGKELYPACWQIGESVGATGRYRLYTQEEIYQDKWFRPSLTYGIPIWFDIEDDLMGYHFIEKHFFSRFKYGFIRKMLILPGFSDEDAADITKGIQDVLASNTNSLPVVCLPPQMPGTAEMKAQTLELGTDDMSQIIQVKNDIRDRLCAHAGLPNLFVGDVEASGGMNNESQQITVMDRYLMDKYNYIDRLCDWIMGWFPKITDWKLRINRPSKAYTDAKKRMDRMQEAQMMKSLGFDIYYMDGEFRYSEEPVDQIQRKEQEIAAAQQAAAGGQEIADGGMMPGDGDGPPEKGTARREDEEIGGAADEVDLSKREADGSQDRWASK